MKISPEQFKIENYSEIETFGGVEKVDNNDSQYEYEYEEMIEENISSYLHSNPSSLNVRQIHKNKPTHTPGSSILEKSEGIRKSKYNSENYDNFKDEAKRSYDGKLAPC